MLGLADKVRATSRKAVQALNHLGMSCVMLTGDGVGSADAIKQQVGLSECHASMKPNEKFEWLTNKQVRLTPSGYSVPLFIFSASSRKSKNVALGNRLVWFWTKK